MKKWLNTKVMKKWAIAILIFFLLASAGKVVATDAQSVVSDKDTMLVIIKKSTAKEDVLIESKNYIISAVPDTSRDIIIIFKNESLNHLKIKYSDAMAENKSLTAEVNNLIVSNNSKGI